MKAKIIIRAAVSKDGYIGNSQNPPFYLPWNQGDLPGDLKRFKEDTTGYPIIMGRKTAETFGGKPLPDRINVVLSNNVDWQVPDGFIVYRNLAQAVQHYENKFDKIFIIGGAQVFNEALADRIVDEMILTETYQDFPGDVKFPQWEYSQWKEYKREQFPNLGYDIIFYQKL